MWNNCRLRASFLLPFILSACSALLLAQSDLTHSPKLLLTPQRLRRLQRDRDRQTVRWANFENRIESVPASPERGFELALHYAISRDAKSGRDAVTWALAHRCEQRQVALVLDWAADQISDSERKQLLSASCTPAQGLEASRDALFMQIATGEDTEELIQRTAAPLISKLQSGDWQNGAQLYAAFEYLYTARSSQHTDLRQGAPQFFSSLPAALLLALKPEQVEHPDWQMHTAALALVGLDPNLGASQYLQGWVMEDAQMIREGEGVGYELLWADPYLPGVGYQNLDPWSYDPDGDLFARTAWDQDACWIHISRSGLDQENCPNNWQQKAMGFGRLMLVPLTGACVQIPKRTRMDEDVIFWKLPPAHTFYYLLNDTQASAVADPSGMWKAPANAEGSVCTSLDTLKVPKAHKPVRK